MRGFFLAILFLLGLWGGAAFAIAQFKQQAPQLVERQMRFIP